MPTLRDIKRRIRSTANMQQITRAMEAVSASKMRKSQMVALGARPYSVKALEMLGDLGETTKEHWMFNSPDAKRTAVLIITSDKGLCGGYNAAVLRKAEELVKRFTAGEAQQQVDLILAGKKAITYFRKRGYETSAKFTPLEIEREQERSRSLTGFTDFGDYIEIEETSPIARLIMDRYKKKQYREVWAVYTNFKSTLKQEAVVRKILPIDLNFIKEIIEGILPEYGRFSETGTVPAARGQSPLGLGEYKYEYILEPTPKEIFKTLLPALFEVAIHHIILESNASEHSARMVAMRNASENASEILETLNLSYNKLRQANITKELLEVIAGKEASED